MELTLENVSYSYFSITGKPFLALKNFSYTFKSGKVYGIFGHTGSGKSTLLQLLIGLLKAQEGKFLIDGKEYHKSMNYNLRKKVGLVFQYPEHQFFEENILKEVAFAIEEENFSEEEKREKVIEALKKLDFPVDEYDLEERSPFELSGGEERKVAIASFLINQPEILILDEPTAGLDPKSCLAVEKLIKSLKREGKGVILVTHDILWALKIVDEVLVLERGNLKFSGARKDYLSNLKMIYDNEESYLPEELIFLKRLEERGYLFPELNYFEIDKIASVIRKHKGRKQSDS